MATTQPLKSRDEIAQVRAVLKTPRDLALFTFSINTAFRASDILSLNVGDVRGLQASDDLVIAEQKTGKRRRVTLNEACVQALQALLDTLPDAADDAPLFQPAKHPGERLTVCSYSRMFKAWCKEAGIKGNCASHTGRKTFGYLARIEGRASLPVLTKAYNHSSQAMTLVYLSIQDDELRDLYSEAL